MHTPATGSLPWSHQPRPCVLVMPCPSNLSACRRRALADIVLSKLRQRGMLSTLPCHEAGGTDAGGVQFA